MANKRFIKGKTLASVWYIKDTKDDTVVCMIMGSGRPEEKTTAMCDVMLNALNRAVEAKPVEIQENW